MPRIAPLAVALALALAATPAGAQYTISGRAADITVGGRLHAQYQASSVGSADNDFFIRRARLAVDVSLSDFLSGRLLTDFAGGTATLLDAYALLDFGEALQVEMGQMKRAFDLFELASSTNLSIIERDGRVGGVDVCTGVGSVCSYSRLVEGLGFAGRDAGARVAGSSGRIDYLLSVTNGRGVGVRDDTDAKSVSGRVAVTTAEGIAIAANVGMRDYLDPGANTAQAYALGADVQVGDWRDGLLVQGGVVVGDNWRSLDPQNDAATFLALQAIGSYYRPLDGERVVGLEPLMRVSVADPARGLDNDGGTVLTPGLMAYFTGRSKIGLNVDVWIPQSGSTELSVKVQTFLYF